MRDSGSGRRRFGFSWQGFRLFELHRLQMGEHQLDDQQHRHIRQGRDGERDEVSMGLVTTWPVNCLEEDSPASPEHTAKADDRADRPPWGSVEAT